MGLLLQAGDYVELRSPIRSQSMRIQGICATSRALDAALDKLRGIWGIPSSTYYIVNLSGVTMKFKSKEFMKALNSFKYSVPDNAEIEITTRNENIDQGQLCDAFMMVATWTTKPDSYDDIKTDVHHTQCIEFFPESENRKPRLTATKSRDVT
jgi:hypothetical protein